MSWVRERLEELGFKDIAENLNRATQPHRGKPSKLSAAQKKARMEAQRRRRLRAQEKA